MDLKDQKVPLGPCRKIGLSDRKISKPEIRQTSIIRGSDVKFSKKYFRGHSGSKLTIFRTSLKALTYNSN